jgi:hypothetical protein
VQLLLFSATFNERIKQFALRISPTANQVRHVVPLQPWGCSFR